VLLVLEEEHLQQQQQEQQQLGADLKVRSPGTWCLACDLGFWFAVEQFFTSLPWLCFFTLLVCFI